MNPSLPAILLAETVARGLSVAALAKRAGVNLRTTQKVVSGDTPNPGVVTVGKLLGALGRDLGWLHRQGYRPATIRAPLPPFTRP